MHEEGKRTWRDSYIIVKLIELGNCVVPLFTSVPSLGIWTGLMAIPFVSFLAFMVLNPLTIPEAILHIFIGGVGYMITVLTGLVILVKSILYLHENKKTGLVKTGPYKNIRHPQYLGMMMIVTAFTADSYVIDKTTLGFSWTSGENMIVIWLFVLFVYVLFAWIEEVYLKQKFKDEFIKYKENSGYFLPRRIKNNELVDIIVSMAIFIILLNMIILSEFIELALYK